MHLQHSQWVEISSGAVRRNLEVFRGLVGRNVRLVAVVKANAYGHGMDQVAPVAAEQADWLAYFIKWLFKPEMLYLDEINKNTYAERTIELYRFDQIPSPMHWSSIS